MLNSKPEILSSKQLRNYKLKILNISSLDFCVCSLFRVSSLVFRVLIIFAFFTCQPAIGDDSIKARFAGQDKLTYDVLFNGIAVGTIEWQYLGTQPFENKTAEVVLLSSNTNILQLLSVESKEKVFLDSLTHLPIKAEREVIFFGRKETIEEVYNQDQGYIKITRLNSNHNEEILKQDKPIHNILSLLYFFPKDLKLVKGKEFFFNLPTQKVNVKVVTEETFILNKSKKRRIYYMVGSGAKKFNLWLDKKERIPLRLEFIVPVGKIILVKKDAAAG